MKESANEDCVQRHFEELWNHGEVEKIDEFFSQEFSNFGVPYSDVRGIIQHIIRTWRQAFPDLLFKLTHSLEGSVASFKGRQVCCRASVVCS
jgi:hypothetical protein